MKLLKFAIIGCGRIANRHAEHISNNGKLVALCDIEIEKAQKLGQQYNVKTYEKIEDLLENESLDVVSICTPNGLHAEHTIMCLKYGNHVLCEKPMAINVHDCGRMIQAAEKANKRLFIIKQNRFNPPIIELKKLIENHKLGKIFSIQLNCFWNRNFDYYDKSNWKGTKNLDGGTLYTQFSHFIDLLYWLIGDVKEVSGYCGNYAHKGIIEFEDSGVVSLKFYNNVIGTINYSINSFSKNMEGSITIFAEKGTVKIGGQYLNELEYQDLECNSIENLPEGNPPNSYGKYFGSMSNHDKVYENTVDVLNNGGVIATNGYEGLKTVEIIDKIYSKAQIID
jgi:predicted dehydrogenase